MILKSVARGLMPRRVQSHRIQRGPLRGFRIVTSWHDYPAAILGTTEADLLAWFEKNVHTGDTWLDVGAHYGYTAIALCRLVDRTGRVFAFEPVLTTAGYLAGTKELNGLSQLTVVPFALGADETMDLAISSTERGMATHRHPDGSATKLFVVGLDKLWPSINGDQPCVDGVKIDVQGMEYQVVMGMLRTLQQWRPKLIIEFHAGVDRHKLISLLAGVGYNGTGIPIESAEDELGGYKDDRSYLFVHT